MNIQIMKGLFILFVVFSLLGVWCERKRRDILYHLWQVGGDIFEKVERNKKRKILGSLKKIFYFLAAISLVALVLFAMFLK